MFKLSISVFQISCHAQFLFRMIIVLESTVVGVVCFICSIVSAIPDDATKDFEPAFQNYPYYVPALTIQYVLLAFQTFVGFVAISVLGQNVFGIFTMTHKAAKEINQSTSKCFSKHSCFFSPSLSSIFFHFRWIQFQHKREEQF